MRTQFFLLLVCIPFLLTAQHEGSDFFEGSINFSVDFTGPQAEILKENDPNSQLLMHLKDGDYIVQLSGGAYPKTFIFVADSNYEYSMDMVNKRAFRYSSHSDMNKATAKSVVKAVPTGKELTIKNVICQEYRMKKQDPKTKEITYFTFFVSDAYRVDVTKFPTKTRAKASFLIPGLDGRIPLKTIKKQRGLTVITTATKMTPKEFDTEQFRIPFGFVVKNRDYRF